MKKKFLILLSIMLIIVVGGILVTVMNDKEEVTEDNYTIVTSFYPMYVLAKNITKDVAGIEIVNLTDYESGCLHDYQLTTQDMKRLENADLFIMNGGGMESFIEEILSSYPELAIIDASEGIDFLTSLHDHDHDHAHEEDTDHDHAHEEDAVHDGEESQVADSDSHEENLDNQTDADSHEGHDHGEFNAHVWLNMDYYKIQIENVKKGLTNTLSEHASAFEVNATAYSSKIDELKQEFNSELSELSDREVVIFHDAFAYLAEQIGLDVVYTVDIDSESSLSAGEIATVVDEVKLHDIKMLFTEEQYSTTIADSIAKETTAKVYVVDSIVTGNMDENGYLDGMKKNLEVLKDVIKDLKR